VCCIRCNCWRRLRVLDLTVARNKSCRCGSILVMTAERGRKSKTPPSQKPRGWGTQTSKTNFKTQLQNPASRPDFRILLQDLTSISNFKITRRNHAGPDEITSFILFCKSV
jgi:hypothetical protein